MSLPSAVFLDRDGVLNRLVERDNGFYSPQMAGDFQLLPRVTETLELLSIAGFLLVVVTNQPDITRGNLLQTELDKMNTCLLSQTRIDAIYVCTHDSNNQCECRKPKPGMFHSAARDFGIDLKNSWTVGDRTSDLIAGLSAGTRVIHVLSGQEKSINVDGVLSVATLVEAAQIILSS